jgi:hypothetical protein
VEGGAVPEEVGAVMEETGAVPLLLGTEEVGAVLEEAGAVPLLVGTEDDEVGLISLLDGVYAGVDFGMVVE